MSSNLGRVGELPGIDGVPQPIRLGKYGNVINNNAGASYLENTYRYHKYKAANTASQALSLITTATYTGLVLINPPNSGVILSLDKIHIDFSTFPVANSQIVLSFNAAAPGTLTGSLILPNPAYLGSTGYASSASGSKAIVSTSKTLAAIPNAGGGVSGIIRALGMHVYSSSADFQTVTAIDDDIGGAISLMPNTDVAICAVTTAISVIASFAWTEYPVPPW